MMLNICSSKPFELDMKATDDILFMELQAFKALSYPLHEVILSKRHDLLQQLIADGCQVNAGNFDGVTPLHVACLAGDFISVQILLQAGANVNVRDIDGANPLCDACNSGKLSCVELLLKYGADVNPKLSMTTPLHEATLKGHVHLIRLLVTSGADTEVNDLHFGTALHVAAYKDHVKCASQLLELGANVNAAKTHHTSLHQAAANNSKQMVEVLLEFGANVYATDSGGKRPSHLTKANTEINNLLKYAERNPRTLMELCRFQLRQSLGVKGLQQLDRLKLPTFLKHYVQYKR